MNNVYFPGDWTIEQCWAWIETRSPYRWHLAGRLMVADQGGFYWRYY